MLFRYRHASQHRLRAWAREMNHWRGLPRCPDTFLLGRRRTRWTRLGSGREIPSEKNSSCIAPHRRPESSPLCTRNLNFKCSAVVQLMNFYRFSRSAMRCLASEHQSACLERNKHKRSVHGVRPKMVTRVANKRNLQTCTRALKKSDCIIKIIKLLLFYYVKLEKLPFFPRRDCL